MSIVVHSLTAASGSVESDARPGLYAYLNDALAQVGTIDLNSSRRVEKSLVHFPRIFFSESFAQGEQR